MDTFFDLFTRPDFQIGLACGIAASVILASSLTVRGLSSRAAGPISVFIFLAVIFLDLGQRLSLAVGVGAVAFAGFLWHRSRIIALIVAVLGASIVMYRSGISDNAEVWVRPLGVAVILAVGWCLIRYEEAGNRPHSVLLLAITLFGIWATVPETRIPRLLLGGWSGLLPGLLVASLPKLGWWAPAVAAPIVWMTAMAGNSRPGSIVGGWASLGILLLRPVPSTKPWQAYVVHAGLVLFTARVAGFRDSPIEAALLSVAGLAAAAAFLWLGAPKEHRTQAVS